MYAERRARVLSPSYQHHTWTRRRNRLSSRCRYSSKSSCVASFRVGWGSRETADGEQAIRKPGSEAEQGEGNSPRVCIY